MTDKKDLDDVYMEGWNDGKASMENTPVLCREQLDRIGQRLLGYYTEQNGKQSHFDMTLHIIEQYILDLIANQDGRLEAIEKKLDKIAEGLVLHDDNMKRMAVHQEQIEKKLDDMKETHLIVLKGEYGKKSRGRKE